jgi:hypothetical protein
MKLLTIGVLCMMGVGMFSCSGTNVDKAIVKLTGTMGQCTGFEVIAPSGKQYTLTASHCALLADEHKLVTAETEDQGKQLIRVIEIDDKSDIMILEPVLGIPGLKVADEDYRGEKVHLVGHGLGLPLWEVDGRIIGDEDTNGWNETFMSGGAMPGHSGSPALDEDNHVIGIVSVSNYFISGLVKLSDLQVFLSIY